MIEITDIRDALALDLIGKEVEYYDSRRTIEPPVKEIGWSTGYLTAVADRHYKFQIDDPRYNIVSNKIRIPESMLEPQIGDVWALEWKGPDKKPMMGLIYLQSDSDVYDLKDDMENNKKYSQSWRLISRNYKGVELK